MTLSEYLCSCLNLVSFIYFIVQNYSFLESYKVSYFYKLFTKAKIHFCCYKFKSKFKYQSNTQLGIKNLIQNVVTKDFIAKLIHFLSSCVPYFKVFFNKESHVWL